jgi:hypothetical protein
VQALFRLIARRFERPSRPLREAFKPFKSLFSKLGEAGLRHFVFRIRLRVRGFHWLSIVVRFSLGFKR